MLVAGTYQGSVGTSDKEITTTALEGAFAARVHANDSDYLVNLGDADLLGETSRYVNYAVVDSSDNAFIVGDFSGDVAFMGDTKAKNQGDRDVFIIKLDPNGKVLFAKTFGSTGKDTPLAIAIAPNKSFYVAGMFGGKILLDGHELLAVGEGDAFLLRFADADGTLMWASTLAGGGEQQLRKIAVADSGDVYAAGRNDGAMVTPSGTIEGIHDGFVVAYDNSGAWRGAITLDDGLSGSLQVGGLAVDGCRLVVVAQFSGTLQLGSDSFIANNSIDLAVASYDLAFTE